MKAIQQQMQNKLQQIIKESKLFRSALTGQQVWDLYIKNFDNDPIFRDPNSSSHNCNLCNNFIRRYGNIVGIDANNKIMTIWDIDNEGEYKKSLKAMSDRIKSASIVDVFFETYNELNSLNYEKCHRSHEVFRLGIAQNHKRYTKEEADKYGVVKSNEIVTFNHFHLDIPSEYVDMSGRSVESISTVCRDSKNVFQRGLEEISLDTLKLVRDLIVQGSLLDGEAHLFKIDMMILIKKEYDELADSERDNWCWKASYGLNIARFRNELIGVLCSDLSQGKELNEACMLWNKRVDPANYMKAKAPITERQIKEAKKFVEENGYEDSFNRRLATIDDIKVTEILHSNVGDGSVKKLSVFDSVKSTASRHKKSDFDKVEEVTIDKFMKDILPTCTSVEAFFSKPHVNNLVTLTTAATDDSKPIFKWSNNYSWTFKGNLAGKSEIKEAVKNAGGKIDGVLRSSMIWNESGTDQSDLDLWCEEPNRVQIGFNTGYRKDRGDIFSPCGGQLDLDNTNPGSKIGVENIYFRTMNKLRDGVYKFWVHQYNSIGSRGFKFEIEFDGQIYQYVYNQAVSGNVQVAEVIVDNGRFSIVHKLKPSSEEGVVENICNIDTNTFHKVKLISLTPNHWGNNNVGNKYYLFMLENCKFEESVRGFHNENLIPELLQHRKVMEVLGSTSMIEPSDKQLSGLGFNATVRDELIVKLKGTHNRMLKIKF